METQDQSQGQHDDGRESGMIMMVVIMTLLPLALIMSAFVTTMCQRTTRLVDETKQERALLACEAGIDEAIYRAGAGTLANGVEFTRTLSSGFSFRVIPSHLMVDGLDNDNDTLVDEADEDVFQITVAGTFGKVTRRVAAYLGPVANASLPLLEGAITMQSSSLTIALGGTCEITGTNYDLDGTLGDPLASTYGITAGPPATFASVTGELSGGEASKVTGVGISPSVTAGAAIDLASIVDEVRNTASVVLPANVNGNTTIGNALANDYRIIYREGNVRFTGNAELSGIMVVTGNLDIRGTFRFNGIIICLGDLENGVGTAEIYGGVIMGPSSSAVSLTGTSGIRYCKQAIDGVNSLIGGTQYVAFNGWQELPRN